MTQVPIPERTVVINTSEERGGGMGTGLVLGVILAIVLVAAVAWFVVAGRMTGSGPSAPATNISPTINIAPPAIKVPDTITINPAAQPAAPAQKPD